MANASHTDLPKRVLIIRPSALGDVSRTVPCLVALRKALPQAQIHWLVNSTFADAVSAHPMLDGVIPFDRHHQRCIPKLLKTLRAARYELAVDLQGLARSGLFARATGARLRVGYANAREGAWLAYNQRFRIPKTGHTVDRMRGLMAAAGFSGPADLNLYVPPAATAAVNQQIAAWNDSPAGPGYACLAPTARWGCKCWPTERFAAVGADLLNAGRVNRLVVLASPSEHAQIQSHFDAALPQNLRKQVVYPQTTVASLMAWIAGARALLGNDSAPLHLAVGLNRPTVSLFGPTNPDQVGPYRWTLAPLPPATHQVLQAPGTEGQKIKYRRHKDDDTLMRTIALEPVLEAFNAAIDGASPPQ
ncbi:MAG: glycosyltransferase family 9 protein [Algisphaera sp.]